MSRLQYDMQIGGRIEYPPEKNAHTDNNHIPLCEMSDELQIREHQAEPHENMPRRDPETWQQTMHEMLFIDISIEFLTTQGKMLPKIARKSPCNEIRI